MRSYFHCSTSRFGRRASVMTILAGSVAAETSLIAFIVFWFGFFAGETGAFTAMLITAAAAVPAGMAVCLLAALRARKKTAMHSRCTYADIQLKAAVISRYAGQVTVYGKKNVWRDLWYIPFQQFVSAEPSRNGKSFIIRGKIRVYGMASDSLGYHVKNGDIEFDRWWLAHGCYTELDRLELPALFGDPKRICASLNEAKKRFDELPKPKKHVFREADRIRRRPKPRSLPDDFTYRWRK